MKGTARWRFAGLLSTGNVALMVVKGRRSTPFVGTESMATPAAPSPRSSIICVSAPPNEWPMMMGGLSRPRMIVS
ncbi:hypothetical protein F0U60_10430 [Archangium minus]|uniref:Secreted protein n=1 Tax=Archangium minus TaxID=83450 RepID=A0ABY9WLJ1_9BACT|nr:hypothetical protein F0U60_10430 [Archangium minus]